MHRLSSVVASILIAVFVAAFLVAINSRRMSAGHTTELVPAYFYPSGAGLTAWNQLARDAGSVRIEAILNPASGPGRSRDPNYVAVVDKLRSAGGSVFGYVSTQYGRREFTAVTEDIKKYQKFYDINGIFVDEMSVSQEICSYYEKIYQFVKSMDSNFKVIGNPGMPYTLESYLVAADTLVIFEGAEIAFADLKPHAIAPWVAKYPADRFANIVYAVRSDASLYRAIAKARRLNVGSIFVTDGGLPNPYNGLPQYWARELAAINATDLAGPPRGKTVPMKKAGK